MVKKLDTCYGIRKGRGAPVVVHSWTEVVNKTNGFSGAEFKKFKSTAEAIAYVNEDVATTEAPSPAPPGTATMWFDGGSRGNPGLSGAGAVIFDDKNVELYSGYKYIGDRKTNNEAEYEGMLLGLLAAVRLGAKQLIVKGDSMLVIQQMMGRWRVAAPKLLKLHRKANEAVKKNKLKCTWQHVPRNLNARADLLANIAMDSKTGDEIFNPSTGVKFPTGNSDAAAAAAAPPPALKPPALKPAASGASAAPPPGSCVPKAFPSVSADSEGTGKAAPLFVDLSGNYSSRISPSNDDASEVAALASATAAYAAVAADARATIAGGNGTALGGNVMDIFGTANTGGANFEERAAQASADAGLGDSRRLGIGLGEATPRRRFMVHIASWRKTEGEGGAAAAILHEEGSWRRLNVLMRVARCRPQPTGVPPSQAGSELGKRRGRAPNRSAPVASDILRALGEVLEEVELLGGGNVAAITNEPALAALLQPASQGVSDEDDGQRTARNNDDDPFPPNRVMQRVLKRWRDLGGVLLDAADENELASAVMLARCCSNPPPVSTLAWNSGASAGANADDPVDVDNVGAAVGKEKLWSSSSDGVSGRALGSVTADSAGAGQQAVGKEKLWSSDGGNTSLGGVGASPFSMFPSNEISSNGKDPHGDCISEMWEEGVRDAVPVEASERAERFKRSAERLEGERESQLRRLDGTTDKADARSAGAGCSMPVSI